MVKTKIFDLRKQGSLKKKKNKKEENTQN